MVHGTQGNAGEGCKSTWRSAQGAIFMSLHDNAAPLHCSPLRDVKIVMIASQVQDMVIVQPRSLPDALQYAGIGLRQHLQGHGAAGVAAVRATAGPSG